MDELKGAESVIVTNALMGALPASEVDGAKLSDGDGLCGRINEALFGKPCSD